MDIALTPDSAGVYAQVFATVLIALAVERFDSPSDGWPKWLRIADYGTRLIRALAVIVTAVTVCTLLPVIGGLEAAGLTFFLVYAAIFTSALALGGWAVNRATAMFVGERP